MSTEGGRGAEGGMGSEGGMGTASGMGSEGVRGAGAAIRRAFVWHLRTMGKASVVFVIISVLLVLALAYLLLRFDDGDPGLVFVLRMVFGNTIAIYMLVIGIIMPLHLELLLGYGLTRRQHAFGLLGASALIAVVLSLLTQGVLALLGGYDPALPLAVLRWASLGQLMFLIGWFFVVGFQQKRVVTKIATMVIGVGLFSVWQFGFAPNAAVSSLSALLHLPLEALSDAGFPELLLSTGILMISCGILFAVVAFFNRRVFIKP